MVSFPHLRSWINSVLYRRRELKQLVQVQTLASSRVRIPSTSIRLRAAGVPGPAWVQGWPAGVWRGRRAHEEPGAGVGALAAGNSAEGRRGLWGVCWCPCADTVALSGCCPAGSEQRATMWSLLGIPRGHPLLTPLLKLRQGRGSRKGEKSRSYRKGNLLLFT